MAVRRAATRSGSECFDNRAISAGILGEKRMYVTVRTRGLSARGTCRTIHIFSSTEGGHRSIASGLVSKSATWHRVARAATSSTEPRAPLPSPFSKSPSTHPSWFDTWARQITGRWRAVANAYSAARLGFAKGGIGRPGGAEMHPAAGAGGRPPRRRDQPGIGTRVGGRLQILMAGILIVQRWGQRICGPRVWRSIVHDLKPVPPHL